ncbi:MAG: 50S ribosomal protein L35 [Deltaproteobacteria bacterium]|jgi:large subunit ribosomal protein L35|nr:50S ribosomal protein L35 [Deltaproteobacteria bacterium]
MPKMKTNRAAAKRFRVSGTGRIRRPKGGASHFMAKKNSRHLRRLRKNDMVDGVLQTRIARLFPYGVP